MNPDARAHDTTEPENTGIDLDGIEHDLADVDRALDRLEDGSYWTDEVTGTTIDPGHLEANPTARRNPA